jgi:hypothetical protein
MVGSQDPQCSYAETPLGKGVVVQARGDGTFVAVELLCGAQGQRERKGELQSISSIIKIIKHHICAGRGRRMGTGSCRIVGGGREE